MYFSELLMPLILVNSVFFLPLIAIHLLCVGYGNKKAAGRLYVTN